MASPGELEEQTCQPWYSRLARGRLGLSASVEETLADRTVEEDLLLDETVEANEFFQERRSAVIIPPV